MARAGKEISLSLLTPAGRKQEADKKKRKDFLDNFQSLPQKEQIMKLAKMVYDLDVAINRLAGPESRFAP